MVVVSHARACSAVRQVWRRRRFGASVVVVACMVVVSHMMVAARRRHLSLACCHSVGCSDSDGASPWGRPPGQAVVRRGVLSSRAYSIEHRIGGACMVHGAQANGGGVQGGGDRVAVWLRKRAQYRHGGTHGTRNTIEAGRIRSAASVAVCGFVGVGGIAGRVVRQAWAPSRGPRQRSVFASVVSVARAWVQQQRHGMHNGVLSSSHRQRVEGSVYREEETTWRSGSACAVRRYIHMAHGRIAWHGMVVVFRRVRAVCLLGVASLLWRCSGAFGQQRVCRGREQEGSRRRLR